jgi:hypothetical protein
LHSGLVEVRFRTSNIQDKINWKNALMQASKQSNTMRAQSEAGNFAAVKKPRATPRSKPKAAKSTGKLYVQGN